MLWASGQWSSRGPRAVDRASRSEPLANRRESGLWKARWTSRETFGQNRNQENGSSQNPKDFSPRQRRSPGYWKCDFLQQNGVVSSLRQGREATPWTPSWLRGKTRLT